MPGRQRSFLVSEMSGRAGVHGGDSRGTSSHPNSVPLAAGCLSSVQQDEWRIPYCASYKGGVILTSVI